MLSSVWKWMIIHLSKGWGQYYLIRFWVFKTFFYKWRWEHHLLIFLRQSKQKVWKVFTLREEYRVKITIRSAIVLLCGGICLRDQWSTPLLSPNLFVCMFVLLSIYFFYSFTCWNRASTSMAKSFISTKENVKSIVWNGVSQ